LHTKEEHIFIGSVWPASTGNQAYSHVEGFNGDVYPRPGEPLGRCSIRRKGISGTLHTKSLRGSKGIPVRRKEIQKSQGSKSPLDSDLRVGYPKGGLEVAKGEGPKTYSKSK